ncbi:MAG: nucleotidyltransferase domain-containing protein [Alphaproteobacteria bacterium]|nr:nucleotidyltransferase domain-containing protein [Alphaproteobacteria bacterium]
MALLDEVRAKRTQLLEAAGHYGVSDIRIFGSVARGEERADSDVDFLVHLADNRDYIDLGGFQHRSAEILNRHTDVLLDSHLNKYIAPYILKDATPL